MSSVATEDMSSVATGDMSSVDKEDMSSVATEDMFSVVTENTLSVASEEMSSGAVNECRANYFASGASPSGSPKIQAEPTIIGAIFSNLRVISTFWTSKYRILGHFIF